MGSGGKREGAGRPAIDGKRISISFRVKPSTKEKIAQLKAKGVNIGRLVDKAIEEYNA